MMKLAKYLTLLFMLFFVVSFGVKPVEAGFGVSPSNIYHEYLKPGGHFEQKITLSRSEADEDLEIVVEPTLEEIADWFTFDPGMKFIFPKGVHRISFTAIIDVPPEATFKTYGGVIRVKAVSAGGPAGGVAIVKGARIDVELLTTELNVTEIEVTQMKIRDAVGDETLKLDINATNRGNTDVSPEAKITIMDLQMQELEVLEAKNFGVLTPNKTEVLTAEFDSSLGTGEYFAQVSVLVNGVVARQDRLVFRISDKTAEENLNKPKANFNAAAKVVSEFVSENLPLVIIFSTSSISLLALAIMRRKILLAMKGKKMPLKILMIILAIISISTALLIIGKQKDPTSEIKESTIEEVSENEKVIEPSNQADNLQVNEGEQTEESTTEGDVQGVFTENSDTVVAEPVSLLMVTAENGNVVYPLYSEPSVTSRIVYYAQNDDKFEVIEEKSEWYRVVLPNGRGGWLPKESVKEAASQER
ncbi:SH3 domain-containing protein [Candidatus Woesebacteria bacterium]|nr:SH3 domain-containing protein [Candidatus Woesebacteria bacterium]